MSGQMQRPQGTYGAGVPWPRYGQQQSAQSHYHQSQSNQQYNQQYGQHQYAQQQQQQQQQQYGQHQYAQQQAAQYQYPPQQTGQPQYAQQQSDQAQYAQQQGSYPQYPTQQASTPTQWPQQCGAQQSNAYPGYSAQPYPATNQYPQYAQSTPPVTAYSQATPVAASGNNKDNTCYNCGSLGHWAQSCPEPRRQNPAGASGHNGPPAKRFRPNYIPPVVTKYEVPDHVKQAHLARINGGIPQSATPAVQPPSISSAGPYQQPYGNGMPPTPISATPSGFTQSQPWSAHVSPPPGVHAPSQAPSTPYTPQQSPHSSTYSNALPPPSAAFPPPIPSGSPLAQGPPKVANGHPKKWQAGVHKKQQLRPRTDRNDTDAVAIKPTLRTEITKELGKASVADKSAPDSATEASFEEDDLSLLDIPDMPTEDPVKYGHLACHLISLPLKTFAATDLPNLIPRPAKDSNGTISSRWIRAETLGVTMQNVRHRADFQQKLDDPIFRFQAEDDQSPEGKASDPRPLSPVTPVECSHGRDNKGPLPAAAPPRAYRPGNSRPRPPSEIQYKTVSNGPVAEIPRASTPIPQADPDASNGDEYDPFNPSAGLPDLISEGSKQEVAPEDDPWNPVGSSDPACEGRVHSPPKEAMAQSNGSQHLERKRSYADTFEDNHNAGPGKKYAFPRKKRGSANSNHSHRW